MTRSKRKVALVVAEHRAGWRYETAVRGCHDDVIVMVQGPEESADDFGRRLSERLDLLERRGGEPCHAVLSLGPDSDLERRLRLSGLLARALSRGAGGTLELHGDCSERAQLGALAQSLATRVAQGVSVRAQLTDTQDQPVAA